MSRRLRPMSCVIPSYNARFWRASSRVCRWWGARWLCINSTNSRSFSKSSAYTSKGGQPLAEGSTSKRLGMCGISCGKGRGGPRRRSLSLSSYRDGRGGPPLPSRILSIDRSRPRSLPRSRDRSRSLSLSHSLSLSLSLSRSRPPPPPLPPPPPAPPALRSLSLSGRSRSPRK